MMRTTLRETLEKTGILVIDGSMSTALEQLGCDLNDRLWTAKALDQQPELVRQVISEETSAAVRGILEQGDRFGDIAVVADRLVEVEHHAEVIFPAPAEKFADFPEYRFPPDARSGFQYNLIEAEPDMVNSP